ncbi:MAG: hypothetical protein GYB31_19430 [Bacteroidetes bacterium]|nr:hypothetical protein [Bacteroidota bacterium]
MPLVILAAGVGRRFGGQKQLTPVGKSGEYLMEFNMFEAWKAGIKSCWLIIRPGTQELWYDLQERWKGKMQVVLFEQPDALLPGTYSRKREKPWGTGHALLAIEAAARSPFLLINADDYYGSDAFKVLLQSEEDMALAAFQLQDTLSDSGGVNRGVCLTRGPYLSGIEEYTELAKSENEVMGKAQSGEWQRLSPNTLVSMNCWKFDPRIFGQLHKAIEEFAPRADTENEEILLPSLLQYGMIEEEWLIRVADCSGPWYGMTFAEDLEMVRAAIQAKQEENPLWK